MRRLLLIAAPLPLAIAALMLAAMLALARVVFVAPVPNTRFIAFDGWHSDGSCLDFANATGHAGHVFDCWWSLHADSRFAVLNNDPAAIAWCGKWIDDWYYNKLPTLQLGTAKLGLFPPVFPGWDGCTYMIPLSIGLYADILIYH